MAAARVGAGRKQLLARAAHQRLGPAASSEFQRLAQRLAGGRALTGAAPGTAEVTERATKLERGRRSSKRLHRLGQEGDARLASGEDSAGPQRQADSPRLSQLPRPGELSLRERARLLGIVAGKGERERGAPRHVAGVVDDHALPGRPQVVDRFGTPALRQAQPASGQQGVTSTASSTSTAPRHGSRSAGGWVGMLPTARRGGGRRSVSSPSLHHACPD
jgi:hypothetical protein